MGRERGHVAAVWNLPEGRPGYVDVYSVRPQAPQSARRGDPYTVASEWADLFGRRSKLGRWTEDAASAPAFRLARAALPYEVRRPQGVWWGVDRVLSRNGQRLVYFDAQGKSFLDRATILAARGVAQGDFADAVEASTVTDEIVGLPPSDKGKGSGSGSESSGASTETPKRRWVAVGVVAVTLGALALALLRR